MWVTRDTVESVPGGKVLKLKGSYFCRGRSSSPSTARRGEPSPFSTTVAINPYLYETPSDVAAYSGFFCSVKCSVAPGRLLSISLSPPSVDPACLPPSPPPLSLSLFPRIFSRYFSQFTNSEIKSERQSNFQDSTLAPRARLESENIARR